MENSIPEKNMPFNLKQFIKSCTHRPLADMVLIRPHYERVVKETEGGIAIPEMAQEKPFSGFVIRVGPNVKEILPEDEVIFGRYSGTNIQYNGENLIVLRESSILLVRK